MVIITNALPTGDLLYEWEGSHAHGEWLTAATMQYVMDHVPYSSAVVTRR